MTELLCQPQGDIGSLLADAGGGSSVLAKHVLLKPFVAGLYVVYRLLQMGSQSTAVGSVALIY